MDTSNSKICPGAGTSFGAYGGTIIVTMELITRHVPEISDLESLFNEFPELVRKENLGMVKAGSKTYPLYGLVIGTERPDAPTIGFFAGVHGLERIGSHVLLAFLRSLLTRATWDDNWKTFFQNHRLVSIPVVNPAGFALNSRSNANGVDLMRNAPVEAEGKTILGLAGQRFSNKLPWFRGGEEFEQETQAVVDFVKKYMFESKVLITLDMHSGFGMQDQLWYPWAKSAQVFPHGPQTKKLIDLFESAYPYHIYKIEAQHLSYTTHGDLWDWLYIEHQKLHLGTTYIPLTLEMGSWMWVRKNIWQLFTVEGLFNPVKKHRYARTMRRHLHMMEFLLTSLSHSKNWS